MSTPRHVPQASSLDDFPPLSAAMLQSSPARPSPSRSPSSSPSRGGRGGGRRQKSRVLDRKWSTPATPVFASPVAADANASLFTDASGTASAQPTPARMLAQDMEQADAPDLVQLLAADETATAQGQEPLPQAQQEVQEQTVNSNGVPDAQQSSSSSPNADENGDAEAGEEEGSSLQIPAGLIEATSSPPPAGALASRRHSAYLQEKIDVYEALSRRGSVVATPEKRAPRSQANGPAVTSADASPLLDASMFTPLRATGAGVGGGMDSLSVSPIVGSGAQALAALHAVDPTTDPSTSDAEAALLISVSPPPASMAGVTSPPQVGAGELFAPSVDVSFGPLAPLSSVDGGGEAGDIAPVEGDQSLQHHAATEFSNELDSERGSFGDALDPEQADSGSILAALNRPSFLGDEEEAQVDVMDEENRRDSTLSVQEGQMQAASPVQVRSSGVAAAESASLVTPPPARASVLVGSSPAASQGQSSGLVSTPALVSDDGRFVSPSTYFGARSAPLGSLRHAAHSPSSASASSAAALTHVRRPSFASPQFVSAEEATSLEFFSPPPQAQRRPPLYEPTPPASATKPNSAPASPSVSARSSSVQQQIATENSPQASSARENEASDNPAQSTLVPSSPASVAVLLTSAESGEEVQGSRVQLGDPSIALLQASPVHAQSVSPRLSSLHSAVHLTPGQTGRLASSSPLLTGARAHAQVAPSPSTAFGNLLLSPISSSSSIHRGPSLTPAATPISALPARSLLAPSSAASNAAGGGGSALRSASPLRSRVGLTSASLSASPSRSPLVSRSPLLGASQLLSTSFVSSSAPTLMLGASHSPSAPRSSTSSVTASVALPSFSSSLSSHLVDPARSSLNASPFTRLAVSASPSRAAGASPAALVSLPSSAASGAGTGSLLQSDYPLTVHVSSHLRLLHRFVLFECELGVDEPRVRALLDRYMRACYGDTSPPSLQRQLLRCHGSLGAGGAQWTWLCVFDPSADGADRLRSDEWVGLFLAQVAAHVCRPSRASITPNELHARAAAGGGASSASRLLAVRFLEERPEAWHHTLGKQE